MSVSSLGFNGWLLFITINCIHSWRCWGDYMNPTSQPGQTSWFIVNYFLFWSITSRTCFFHHLFTPFLLLFFFLFGFSKLESRSRAQMKCKTICYEFVCSTLAELVTFNTQTNWNCQANVHQWLDQNWFWVLNPITKLSWNLKWGKCPTSHPTRHCPVWPIGSDIETFRNQQISLGKFTKMWNEAQLFDKSLFNFSARGKRGAD